MCRCSPDAKTSRPVGHNSICPENLRAQAESDLQMRAPHGQQDDVFLFGELGYLSAWPIPDHQKAAEVGLSRCIPWLFRVRRGGPKKTDTFNMAAGGPGRSVGLFGSVFDHRCRRMFRERCFPVTTEGKRERERKNVCYRLFAAGLILRA